MKLKWADRNWWCTSSHLNWSSEKKLTSLLFLPTIVAARWQVYTCVEQNIFFSCNNGICASLRYLAMWSKAQTFPPFLLPHRLKLSLASTSQALVPPLLIPPLPSCRGGQALNWVLVVSANCRCAYIVAFISKMEQIRHFGFSSTIVFGRMNGPKYLLSIWFPAWETEDRYLWLLVYSV